VCSVKCSIAGCSFTQGCCHAVIETSFKTDHSLLQPLHHVRDGLPTLDHSARAQLSNTGPCVTILQLLSKVEGMRQGGRKRRVGGADA